MNGMTLFSALVPLLIMVFMFPGLFRKYAAEKKVVAVAENFEKSLKESGFVISRKVIGGFPKNTGAIKYVGYYLFVDDVNKKWVMTSPYNPEIGKVRSYSDLLDYDFFDNDGSNIIGKIGTGLGTAMGIAAGAVLASSFVGVAAAGFGGAKAGGIFGSKGESVEYGILLKTKDCDVNNTAWVFDFANIIINHSQKHMGRVVGAVINTNRKAKMGIGRGSAKYRKDVDAIQEMAQVFEYIIQSNEQ
jgi:hypothetical protein